MSLRQKLLGVCVAVCVFNDSASAQMAASLNLKQAFAPTKQLLAAGGQADVVVLGDSLSFRSGSYLPYFRSQMQNAYGNAGGGYQAFSIFTGAGLDSGWTVGQINSDSAPHMGLDGLWASTTVATTAFTTSSDSAFKLQYIVQPGGGTMQPFVWTQTGQQAIGQPIDTNASTTSVKTWNYTLPPGASSIWFQTSGTGTVTVLGQQNVTSTPGVRVDRAANGGWGVADFEQRDSTFDDQIKLESPKLVMIWLGQNDQGYSKSSYEQHLRSVITRLQGDEPDAKVVLVGSYDSGSPNLTELISAMQDVASTDGVGFINMYMAGGNYASNVAAGHVDPDGIHFTDAGGQFFGNLLFDAFQTDGLSPFWQQGVPEPTLLLPVVLLGTAMRFRRRKH